MNLTKEQVCVFIEDDAQLEKAINVLNKYNEKHSRFEDSMLLNFSGKKFNYLTLLNGYWFLADFESGKQITLKELEKLLKQ